MGIGVIAIQTSQKLRQSGPPFVVTSAVNGLSIDALGRVVLGQNVGAAGNPAVLLSSREIPMGGFTAAFLGNTVATSPFIRINANASITYTDNSNTNSVVMNLTQTRIGVTRIQLQNLSVNASAAASFQALNDAGRLAAMAMISSIGTALGSVPDSGAFTSNGLNGILVNAFGGATAGIYFGTNTQGSTSICLVITAGGNTILGALGTITPTDNGARLQVGGNATVSGTSGFGGITAMTARVHIAAGTAVAGTGPLKLTSGVNLTAAEQGVFEFNGTNLFFTRVATREAVFVGNDGAAAPATTAGIVITNFYGTAATNYLGDPVSWAAVNINGTAYKVPLYT